MDKITKDILDSGITEEEMNFLVEFIGSENNVVTVRQELKTFLNDGDPKNNHAIPRSISCKESKNQIPWDRLMELAKRKYYPS